MKADNSYAELLFDTTFVHSVDVVLAEEDWEDLKKNSLNRTKYHATITIDGETVKNVAFSAKGQASLTAIANDPDCDRYGFKVNFGKFTKGRKWHGLSKVNLSALYGDATYMKDFISYKLFRMAGVDAPLMSYVWLTINGRAHGLYAAIEDLNKGFLNRTTGGEGTLYKPEPDHSDESWVDNQKAGASLVYKDEKISTYSEIFNNNVTKVKNADKRRVITALRGLSDREDLDRVLDTEEIIRYFAVHNFLLNFDSYLCNERHNYGLYERDGKLAMIPWNYNMAFACFSGSSILSDFRFDSTTPVNWGIDTPLLEPTGDERPMWQWIVDKEDTRQQYHAVLDTLLTEIIDTGMLEQRINALYTILLPYVEKDPIAFYTPQDFKTGVDTMKLYIRHRSESIRKQLNGDLSTIWKEQNPEDRVDCSDLIVHLMGTVVSPREVEAGLKAYFAQKNEENTASE